MIINNSFIFTHALKNNSDYFKNIKLEIIQNMTVMGTFDYKGLKYSFMEYLNEDISLLDVTFMAITKTNKNRSEINKLLLDQNKYLPNIKFKLSKFESNDATFSLSFAVMSDTKLKDPMAIILPSIEALLVSFIQLKNML